MTKEVEQALRIARLRRAMQKIADLPLPRVVDKKDTRLRARRIAISALRDTTPR